MSEEDMEKGYDIPDFSVKIDDTDLEEAALKAITRVSVTKKIDQADYFSLELQDELNEGQLVYLGSDTFKYGKKVSISMGYVGDTTLTMDGYIEEISAAYSSGIAPTFTLHGKDKAFTLLTQKSPYTVYVQKKDSDIVTEIAGEVSLTPDVEDTGETPPERKEKRGGTSYLSFIKKMVEENDQYEFFVSEGTLYFRKNKSTEEPVVSLQWGEHILSFNPRLNLSSMLTGVTFKWWDQLEQTAIEGVATSEDETSIGDGTSTAGVIAAELFSEKVTVVTDQPVLSNEDAKSKATALLNKNNESFITGNGETVGINDLVPGVMIEVLGIDDWFGGKYYVEETTHTISGDQGYRTTFHARRNTI
jgi:Bacteriophage probable baseplate hub protein